VKSDFKTLHEIFKLMMPSLTDRWNAHIYTGHTDKPSSFPMHFDPRDNFILQVEGTSRFIVPHYFDKIFIDVAPLTRTNNFANDAGIPFNDYDPELARELLKQESFDEYMVVNLTGGKSWKVGDYFIGLFASVNNLLDKEYKSGGFEQGRNANYRELRDDNANPKRVFGPRYWYGRGTTYFLNLNFRF